MDNSNLTPLRLGMFIFLGILILGVLIFNYIPGNYINSTGKSLEMVTQFGEFTPTDFFFALKSTKKKSVLIDVRSEEKYKAGHIENAKSYPLSVLANKKRIKNLKRKQIFVYGSSGAEAAKAAVLLKMVGINAMPVDRGYAELSIFSDKKKDSRSAEEAKYNYNEYFKALETKPEPIIEVKLAVPKPGGC